MENNKDMNFWLKTKWIGALLFLVFCLGSSFYYGLATSKVIGEYLPIFEKNAADFLPITIEDGMIVKPENTRIERSYPAGKDALKVVLDTQAEEFEQSLLTENGIYISRAYIYTVSNNKVEIRSLRDIPNVVIDEEILNHILTLGKQYITPVVFGFMLVWSFVGGLICMGLFSMVLHWFMSAFYKAPYRQTLRLTVYAYVALHLLAVLAGFTAGFWITFALAAILNVIVNISMKNDKPVPETPAA